MTDHTGAWSIRAWDLVRATLCGTAALILVGTVVYQLTTRDQNHSEGLVGAVLVLAFIAAVAYRHLGALITSAAVVIMGGFAFLLGNHAVYVHLNRNSDIYLARSLDASPCSCSSSAACSSGRRSASPHDESSSSPASGSTVRARS